MRLATAAFPAATALAVMATAPLLAQTLTTGSIGGTILSRTTGALQAGLQVRLTSAQITRTVTTDAQGRFLAGLLNPGHWHIVVDKPGYQTWTAGIPVSLNAETPVLIRLVEVEGATVSVTAETAMDFTSLAGITTRTEETLKRLPLARNMSDLALLAPTSVVGPATLFGEGLGYSINGASGAESQFLLDGLVTNDPRYGGQGTDLVTDFLESAEVQTSGFKPEYSTMGGVFSAALKSGTNTFKGVAWATYLPGALTAGSKGNSIAAETAPPSRYDLGFHAGGPLLKDRFFYFVGVDADQYRIPADSGQIGMYPTPGGGRTIINAQKTRALQVVTKLNWYLNPDQQFTVSIFGTRRTLDVPFRGPTTFSDANYGAATTNESTNVSLVYDHTLTPNLFLSVKLGSAQQESRVQPEDTSRASIEDHLWFSPGGGGPDPRYEGQTFMRGGYGLYFSETSRSRQVRADLIWAPGRHEVKIGASRTDLRFWRQDWASGPPGGDAIWAIYPNSNSPSGLMASSDQMGQIGGATITARQHAFYVQDSWEVRPGFRAFYGLRAETQEHFDRLGKRVMAFTKLGDGLEPRLGFTWDPNRDGRSKVSGSYAWYHELVPLQASMMVYGNFLGYWRFYNLDTYDPRGLGTLGAQTGALDMTTPYVQEPVAEGLKLPRRTEITLGYERDLGKGFTFTFRAVSRKLDHPMEDSLILRPGGTWADGQAYDNVYAPGVGYIARGIRWNPGPSVSWIAPPGDVDAQGNPIGGKRITVTNTLFKEATNQYLALTMGLQQRGERSFWSLTYTWSHFYGDYQGVIANDLGGGAYVNAHATGYYDTWAYVGTGNLALDRRHNIKLDGYRRFTLAGRPLTLGAKWTWVSGLPISQFDDGSTTAGLPPGTMSQRGDYSLDPGQYGMTPDRFLFGNHGRAPSQSVVDLHLDLEFHFMRTKLVPVLDVFNLFNTRVATAIWQMATYMGSGLPNPNFGEAQSWVPGRRFQVGARVVF
ncbi:MAG: TonB-dependent receptor [Holophagaceae bacterium]|uniref:TonB-dependent receptor n=1 Tax=Candidatus Geothrix skivensis TaxID=2954439 RepID=A0A9D7XKL8_9BACT|nr:TonB-dependent receptor [Candidatus Geothrix skivensis]